MNTNTENNSIPTIVSDSAQAVVNEAELPNELHTAASLCGLCVELDRGGDADADLWSYECDIWIEVFRRTNACWELQIHHPHALFSGSTECDGIRKVATVEFDREKDSEEEIRNRFTDKLNDLLRWHYRQRLPHGFDDAAIIELFREPLYKLDQAISKLNLEEPKDEAVRFWFFRLYRRYNIFVDHHTRTASVTP